ncbi:hypothetical protein HK097_011343 [Rhizophlyctis rosea]|uniref:Uncharacterized protein n=1 Tax=Rhizophlyctis rosea TaxID=64517 RepID=A0AAD5S891_9FUNG|nr:hypothetical protein HK097_011343 [Rhizophlyctis rosea]
MTKDTYSLPLSTTHSLTLLQNTSSGTSGTTIWPGGRDLASYLALQSQKGKLSLHKKRLVDLGTGTGIVGLTAAHCGASVTLTDQEHIINGAVLSENIAANADETAANGGNISTLVLDWNIHAQGVEGIDPPYDIVCGADVMYDISFAEPLSHTIAALTDTKSTIYIAYERRDPLVHDRFMEVMKELGFKGTKVTKRATGKIQDQDSLVDIWKFKKVAVKSLPADA